MNEDIDHQESYVPYTANGCENELTTVQIDHCYAKPWNWRQEIAHCKPMRTLFFDENVHSSNKSADVVDVESDVVDKNHNFFNIELTEKGFLESESKLNLINIENTSEDWEENVKRDGWTPLQHRIFNKVVKILTADKLARLAFEDQENGIIQKKIHCESSAKKLRIVLSSVSWDIKITQWLHLTLIENLNNDYLICYVAILQILRNRVPSLVDRMLYAPVTSSRVNAVNVQIMNYIVEKPWEPVASNTSTSSKLPVMPFIVMVPSGTVSTNTLPRNTVGCRRYQTWCNLFQSIGRVIPISLHSVSTSNSLPLPVFVEGIISVTLQKVQELKTNYPGRPVVLVGLQQGALIAAQVAYMEPVAALICLGFPLFCVDGKRGEPDDFILDIRSPTMIIIGQNSSTCTTDGIEQLRHRMKAETSFLVVGGALDSLRMLRSKKRQQSIVQSTVDSNILDEINTFLANVISNGTPADKRSPGNSNDRKLELQSTGSAAKRTRIAADFDDSSQGVLSGHNYSQSSISTPSTPFVHPWRGRSGTGLSRVRGGRSGTHHSRNQYHRTLSELQQLTPKSRSVRAASTGTLISGSQISSEPGNSQMRTSLHRKTSNGVIVSSADGQNEGEFQQSNVSSIQGSPNGENPSVQSGTECKGGDSSETESAPLADDDDEILEDLKFCNELLNKFQQSNVSNKSNSLKDDESTDFQLHCSGDEDDIPLAEVCRRLNTENDLRHRNRQLNKS